MSTTEALRKQFEACINSDPCHQYDLVWDESIDSYDRANTHDAWVGFRAALAAAAPSHPGWVSLDGHHHTEPRQFAVWSQDEWVPCRDPRTWAVAAQPQPRHPVGFKNSGDRTFDGGGLLWKDGEIPAQPERPVAGLGRITFEDETHELLLGFKDDESMRAHAATLGLTVDVDDMPQPEAPAEPSAEYLPQTWVAAVADECGVGVERMSCLFDFAERVQRATRLATPAPVAQQPAELTDERIDAIAEIVVKGMPDGIQGFLKSWGWRQFARAILEDCAGHYAAPALTSPQPAEPVNRQLFDALQALHNHCEELKSQLDAVPPANRSACPISQGLTWHLATATRALQDASAPTAQQPEELGITPEMITAYLQANDAYWHDADSMPFNTRDPSKWRSGTPREATLAGLRAALAIIKAQGGSQ